MTHQRGFVWWLYLAAAFAVALVLTAAYKYVDTHWETSAGIARGTKDKQAEWDAAVAEQRAKEQKAAESAVVKVEKENAKARVVYRTITRSVDKYIDRPVYRNVCFDTDGLRDAQAALSGALPATAKPDGRMPKPDAAR
jgi:hypothetical protein